MIESAPPPPPSSPEHTQGGDISIHSDGSRPVGLSCISFDLTASNEKKLGYLTGNKSRHLDGIRVGSCLNTWPLEEGQKYELVLIWSRELCELCWASERRGEAGRGRNRHKWSNYLRMRSLFGSISSRLWLREAQLAKQHNWLCYLIAEPASLCKDFFFFFRGVLSILSAGCFSHHSLYLFSDNESIVFAVWKIDGFIRLCVLNVYHMMCAHALSEHGPEAAGR